MVAQAIMLGLIAGIGILDGRIFGQMMFDRPLVTGLLVGLVLGDVKNGIIIGAQLELIWMGIAGIGASTPPDVVTGGILGTAFAILSNSGVEVACMWIPVGLFFLSTFLPTFLAILLGADKVTGMIEAVPNVILDGLSVAGNLLPAIGFALLLDMLFSKKMAPFFFLGFLAAAYGGLNITAIALIGACIAVILHFYIEQKKESIPSVPDNLTEGEIDFE